MIAVFNKPYIKAALVLLVLIILPILFNSPLNMRIIIEIGIFSIVVLGLNLLMGLAGQISMGHAGIFGISAYITGLLSSGRLPFELPILPSMIIAIIVSTGLSYLIAIPILKLKGHYLAMGTLSIGIIIYTVLVNIPNAGGFDGFSGIPRMWLFGEKITKNILGINKYLNGYIIVYAILIILLWLSFNLYRSKIGRAFKAIHTSEIAAASLGIDVTNYKILVFTISGFYASIAGVLFAHFYCGLSPGDFSVVKSITLVTMTVLGGTSSIWGALIGTAFLTFITYILEYFQDFAGKAGLHINLMDYNILTYGGIFLIILIFLPDGITGLKDKIKNYWSVKFAKSK